jgi:hypothetical protein
MTPDVEAIREETRYRASTLNAGIGQHARSEAILALLLDPVLVREECGHRHPPPREVDGCTVIQRVQDAC